MAEAGGGVLRARARVRSHTAGIARRPEAGMRTRFERCFKRRSGTVREDFGKAYCELAAGIAEPEPEVPSTDGP
jgi:hypothetical protein